MIDDTNNDSAVSGSDDTGPKDHKQVCRPGSERAVVLITGDSLGHPPELDSLLRECGCSAFVTADLDALQNTTHPEPDVVIVNFASIETANPVRVPALQKKYGKPVICLLPHPAEHEVDRVAALRGDLLIFKPLCAREFKSRIRLLLREQRAKQNHRVLDRGSRGSFLQICARDNTIVVRGERIRLTRRECALLSLIASGPGRVFSIEEIIRSVWSGKKRAMASDVHQCVYALRRKIEKDPHNPRCIVTVPSVGYSFAPCSGT